MYEYTATVIKVVDGDTVHAMVDVGFSIRVGMSLRLLGINSPELSTPEGKVARTALELLLHFEPGLGMAPLTVIRTERDKTEKYGRFLATLWRGSDGTWIGHEFVPTGSSLNQLMVDGGHAVPYDGGKR